MSAPVAPSISSILGQYCELRTSLLALYFTALIAHGTAFLFALHAVTLHGGPQQVVDNALLELCGTVASTVASTVATTFVASLSQVVRADANVAVQKGTLFLYFTWLASLLMLSACLIRSLEYMIRIV